MEFEPTDFPPTDFAPTAERLEQLAEQFAAERAEERRLVEEMGS